MILRTCPECGSTNITTDTSIGIPTNRYKCKTCGYAGDVILEQEVEKKAKK